MYYLNEESPMIHFQEIKEGKFYVDKSLLIKEIISKIRTTQKYICITRPRRFGKTINANMLASYFSKGYESQFLFDGLKISSCERYKEYINQYNVIHIDFSILPNPCKTYDQYIDWINRCILHDLKETYSLEIEEGEPISSLLSKTHDSFIFILDEWDFIFYKDFVKEKDKQAYLEFIKNLLKDKAYVELAYMTGVLPIAKYSSGSELNMFDEYNVMNDNIFDDYFGFQEDEVKKICNNQNKITYQELKQWYNGYYTSTGNSLFNPRSVTKALERGICLNFWTETGPMNEIANCIEHNVNDVKEDVVKMVSGIPVEVELDGYSAASLQLDTRDEILSAMVVYGFLSYYEGLLSIPNKELMTKFQNVLKRESMGEIAKITQQSKVMLEATICGDEDKVAEILEHVHDQEIPFITYKDENSLSMVVTLSYLYAREIYRVEREEKSGKGYCDFIFYPIYHRNPAIILELKFGKSPEEAIQQIKDKNYMSRIQDSNKIILCGINYDIEKHHSCKIEIIEK